MRILLFVIFDCFLSNYCNFYEQCTLFLRELRKTALFTLVKIACYCSSILQAPTGHVSHDLLLKVLTWCRFLSKTQDRVGRRAQSMHCKAAIITASDLSSAHQLANLLCDIILSEERGHWSLLSWLRLWRNMSYHPGPDHHHHNHDIIILMVMVTLTKPRGTRSGPPNLLVKLLGLGLVLRLTMGIPRRWQYNLMGHQPINHHLRMVQMVKKTLEWSSP